MRVLRRELLTMETIVRCDMVILGRCRHDDCAHYWEHTFDSECILQRCMDLDVFVECKLIKED